MDQISRTDLHRRLCAKPALKVAAELGISSSALKRICRAMEVPTPPPGFWAKRQAGQKPPCEPLGRPTKSARLWWKLNPENRLRQTERGRRTKHPLPSLIVPGDLKAPSPEISEIRDGWDAAEAGASAPEFLPMRGQFPSGRDRALAFLDSMAKSADAFGLRLTAGNKVTHHPTTIGDGENFIGFTIQEWAPGLLRLDLDSSYWFPQRLRLWWREGCRVKLEQRLPRIFEVAGRMLEFLSQDEQARLRYLAGFRRFSGTSHAPLATVSAAATSKPATEPVVEPREAMAPPPSTSRAADRERPVSPSFSPSQWDDIADRAARLIVEEAKEKLGGLESLLFLKLREVARLTGLSRNTITQRFKTRLEGGVRLVRYSDFLAWVHLDSSSGISGEIDGCREKVDDLR